MEQNNVFKKALPGILCLALTLTPLKAVADAGTCSVENQTTLGGVLTPVYVDRFQSGERNVSVNFSAHTGIDEQTILVVMHQLARSLWTWGDRAAKDDLAAGIRQILREGAPFIRERRENLRALLELHNEEPFTWVGVESPPGEQIESREEMIEMAAEIRSLLTRKMGSRISEQEINDLLLLLIGEEDYLFMEGEEFTDLPRVPTEDVDAHARFGDGMYTCYDNINLYSEALYDTPYYEPFIEIVENLDGDDSPGELRAFREGMDSLAGQLISGGAMDPSDRQGFLEIFRPCEVVFSRERDIFLARQMQGDLPAGRGLIFRGTGHRGHLTEEFLRLCSNESATGRPLEEDGDEGTE